MGKFIGGMIAGLVVFFFGVTVGVVGEEALKDERKTGYRKGCSDTFDDLVYARIRNKGPKEEETEE